MYNQCGIMYIVFYYYYIQLKKKYLPVNIQHPYYTEEKINTKF